LSHVGVELWVVIDANVIDKLLVLFRDVIRQFNGFAADGDVEAPLTPPAQNRPIRVSVAKCRRRFRTMAQ
jgi:hypothetical protein